MTACANAARPLRLAGDALGRASRVLRSAGRHTPATKAVRFAKGLQHRAKQARTDDFDVPAQLADLASIAAAVERFNGGAADRLPLELALQIAPDLVAASELIAEATEVIRQGVPKRR